MLSKTEKYIKMIHRLLFVTIIPLISACWSLGSANGNDTFEYCDIHLPENLKGEAEHLHLNNVETDWGLWGHNLSAAITEKVSKRIYASTGGVRNDEQFCFTSEELYRSIEQYVINNYGEDGGVRFAILPNDNKIVCQCAACVRMGNTAKDATPAVCYMIERLCDRFPDHYFFTSYYSTTRSIPAKALPRNGGVLVSAIDFYLGFTYSEREKNFIETLRKWGEKSGHVYVWDYINNFDDYLTPCPLFTIMQNRLGLYADTGVKGLFLNGSSYDYSTFSDIKTNLYAALRHNPQENWMNLLNDYCAEHYPVTGKLIANFIIKQEIRMFTRQQIIPIYGGIGDILNTYLPEEAFITFHNELIDLLPQTTEDEYEKVRKLCNALAYTRLEIMRHHGDISQARPMLKRLAKCLTDDIKIYSESCWTLQSYINDYNYILEHAEKTGSKNLLRGQEIKALTTLDEDYKDLSPLTDGLLALPSNYHCGHVISSEGKGLTLSVPCPPGMRTLRVCLTRNALFRLDFPSAVTLTVNGREVSRAVPHPVPDAAGHSFVEFTMPASLPATCQVRLLRESESVRGFGIEEIEGFK